MTHQTAWEDMKNYIEKTVARLQEMRLMSHGEVTAARIEGKIEATKLLLSYMQDAEREHVVPARARHVGTRQRARRWDTDTRTVHGTGTDEQGFTYDVVRYTKAGKWWLEWGDGATREVSVQEAVEAAESVKLGLPGGAHFDRLWMRNAGLE